MSIVASHHTITIAGMAHLKRMEIIDGWDGMGWMGASARKKTGLLCSELGTRLRLVGLTRISPLPGSCPEALRAFPALPVRSLSSGLGTFRIPDDRRRGYCTTTTTTLPRQTRARARASGLLLLRRASKDALPRSVVSRGALREGPGGSSRRTRTTVARARALPGRPCGALEDADGRLEGGGWGDDARDGSRPGGRHYELGHGCLFVSTYTHANQRAGKEG
jgi:hypothetical protein